MTWLEEKESRITQRISEPFNRYLSLKARLTDLLERFPSSRKGKQNAFFRDNKDKLHKLSDVIRSHLSVAAAFQTGLYFVTR